MLLLVDQQLDWSIGHLVFLARDSVVHIVILLLLHDLDQRQGDLLYLLLLRRGHIQSVDQRLCLLSFGVDLLLQGYFLRLLLYFFS